jgi:hypothetical protein
VIRGWNGAARSIAARPAAAAACERFQTVLHDHLLQQTTMAGLAETYLADGGRWPVDLSKPIGPSGGIRLEVIVAAAYWQRYRELIEQATASETTSATEHPIASAKVEEASDAPTLEPVDITYTTKLWQRGPLRLRSIPLERRSRYEALISEAYLRIVDCEDIGALASRYYADGEWVLEIAQERLPKLGEPPSSIGWIQDAAYWRRCQELQQARIVREECERCHPGFALWLAQQMARQHMSVPELARRLSVESPVVRSWICGTALPGAEQGPRLAAVFGISESQWPRVAEAASA